MKKPILIGVGIVVAFFALFILADSLLVNDNSEDNLVVEDFTMPKSTSTQKFVDEVYGVEFEYPSFIQITNSFITSRRSIPLIVGYEFILPLKEGGRLISQFIIASTTESDVTKLEYTYKAWHPDGNFSISNKQIYSSSFGTALVERITDNNNGYYADWFHFIKNERLYSYISTFSKIDPGVESKANEMFNLFLKTFTIK